MKLRESGLSGKNYKFHLFVTLAATYYNSENTIVKERERKGEKMFITKGRILIKTDKLPDYKLRSGKND